jgi:RHS repeat-associated protein
VTENDYLYAGERFDQTTKLYHLRARYMDPSTGTFMTMDTFQGNMQDPMSLHKYLYANANPISNTDPTGLTSLGEMASALHIRNILDGASGLNYWMIFNMLKNAAYAVQFAYSMRALVTSVLTGDIEGIYLSLANGAVSVMSLVGICESHMAMQILTKALAAYGIKENGDAFLNAVGEGDVEGMIISGLYVVTDIITLFEK